MKNKFFLSLAGTVLSALVGSGSLTLSAAVTVHGLATSTGPQIHVEVLADITEVPLRGFGARLDYEPAKLRLLEASNNSAAWFFYDGVKLLPYAAPDISIPGQVRFLGAKLDVRSPGSGVSGNNVLLGSALFDRLSSGTPSFYLKSGRISPFADFVTQYGAPLDTLSGEVVLGPVVPDPADTDLDGLLDAWERQYFGDITKAYYSDDPDGDGFTNLQEQALGSDPTRADSNFQVTLVPEAPNFFLKWTSFRGRSYRIEKSSDLVLFKAFQQGIVATPPLNSFSLGPIPPTGSAFFRVVLE